jgi:hypothetical protein
MTAFIQNISESLSVKDERRASSRCVVSDILIGSGDITQTQFDALLTTGSAVGYNSFANFIEGDYEYKNAIFKGTMGAQQANDPRITLLKVNVDVPDVFDRGTGTTSTTAAVLVTCTRQFYQLYEVTATLKGGTVIATPRVSNLTVVNRVATFNLELIDINNNRVVGDVSWSAKGY